MHNVAKEIFRGLLRIGLPRMLVCLVPFMSGSVQLAQGYPNYFPVPSYTKHQVAFWEAIFDRYSGDTEVIHDIDFPAVVIDVINFKTFAERYRQGAPYSRRERRNLIKRYVERYNLAIKRIAKEGRDAVKHGAMEKRVFYVYSRHKDAQKGLYRGQASLRTQAGLRDEFSRAVQRAQAYLPHMEEYFRRAGLPADLTRMVFVESMFNLEARSKVGASGIWQFMPGTGRIFMKVNRWIDERNSPLKATVAAARLLKNNYDQLKSWPLAITAYNHGAGGLLKATRKFKTKDIGIIAQNYKSRTFGFASRNFYAEFVAARKVFDKRYRGAIRPHLALSVKSIKLQRPVSISELVRRTPLNTQLLKKYNNCLTDQGFDRYTRAALPQGFEIFVPSNIATQVRKFVSSRFGSGSQRSKI